MDRTNLSTPAPRGFAVLLAGWRSVSVLWWMAAAFLVCLLLAAAVLAVFGAGERGTVLALRLTARWCFLLFWFAYAGGPLAKLWNLNLFAELARHGREFGLAFASALAVHVALILWHYHIATPPDGAMLFFWVGVFCAYLLALFSLPGVRDALGPARLADNSRSGAGVHRTGFRRRLYLRSAAGGRRGQVSAVLRAVCCDACWRRAAAHGCIRAHEPGARTRRQLVDLLAISPRPNFFSSPSPARRETARAADARRRPTPASICASPLRSSCRVCRP